MISNFRITVGGLQETISANDALISELEKQSIIESILDDIIKDAKLYAPIKTGALINSLRWTRENNQYVIEAIYYAEYLEFGLRIPVGDTEAPRQIRSGGGKTAYLPFIRPAILNNVKNLEKTLAQLLNAIYKR